MFKDDFKGTGSMKRFVDESNSIFRAFNNPTTIMPSGYSGGAPRLYVKAGEGGGTSLVLDMSEAAIFNPSDVRWINGTGSISVEAGICTITVD